MNMLVTGGTGFLGKRLAMALLERGHRVRILGRNMAPVQALLAQGARPVVADLRDRDAVIAACAGVDVVFHVGALSAPWGRRADFFETNVGGTESVLAGCRAHGVKRMIYVSSPSVVFDGRDQRLLTEDAPYPRRFASIYSLTKKIGEDRVRAAQELETVILRPKAIFGPGDSSLLPRLIAAARQGRLPQIGDGRNLVDLTYVDNVVHALLLACEAQAAATGQLPPDGRGNRLGRPQGQGHRTRLPDRALGVASSTHIGVINDSGCAVVRVDIWAVTAAMTASQAGFVID